MRPPPGERTGTPAVIILDNREGDPDLTGAKAVFEGYFDPETGDRRRPGEGIPRLRVGSDRVWGFECWWRADPAGTGLVPDDHSEVEVSKRLLRGLIREARRPVAFARRPPPS
jgi:hypothetical protein